MNAGSAERTPMPSVGRAVWTLLLLVPGCFLIGTSYATALVGPVLVGAGVLAVLVFLLGVRVGVSRWATGLLTALLLVLVAYLATAGPGGSLRATLGDAVPRLLTAPRPLPVTGELLAPTVLLVGVVAILVAVRSTTRRREAVTPVVGGLVLYVAGVLLSSGQGDRFGLLAVLLAAIAVLGWAMVDGPARTGAAVRSVAPLLLVVAPALALLVAFAAAAPRAGAFEPRSLVTPPLQQLAASSPLPQLAAWNEHPAEELFRVRGDRYPLRMVTLTTYDGNSWTASTRYRPLGGYESADLPAGVQRVRMQATVTLKDLDGPWLPTVGTPASVSESDALVDPETGSTVLPGRPAAAFRYTVAGDIDAPSDFVLPNAVVPPRAETKRYLGVPDLPKALSTYADLATKDVTTPYGKAKAIEKAVQGGRVLNPQAVGGSSYFRLQQFLLGERGTTGAQKGTSEQFATAFAVLARAEGLPTRIVVGFRPGTDLGKGVRSVRGSDAFAWPEVYFTQVGWVPFSPTPEGGGFTQPDPAQDGPKADQDAPPAGDVRSPTGTPGSDTDRPGLAAVDDATLVPIVAGSVGGLVVLLLGGLVLARTLRRRRHRAGGATGAWQEVLDAARLCGVPLVRTLPATALAVRIDHRAATSTAAPEAGAVTVARRAEHAAFAPDAVGDDTIWDVAVTTSRSLRRSLPWWRRLTWSLDPRAFRR